MTFHALLALSWNSQLVHCQDTPVGHTYSAEVEVLILMAPYMGKMRGLAMTSLFGRVTSPELGMSSISQDDIICRLPFVSALKMG